MIYLDLCRLLSVRKLPCHKTLKCIEDFIAFHPHRLSLENLYRLSRHNSKGFNKALKRYFLLEEIEYAKQIDLLSTKLIELLNHIRQKLSKQNGASISRRCYRLLVLLVNFYEDSHKSNHSNSSFFDLLSNQPSLFLEKQKLGFILCLYLGQRYRGIANQFKPISHMEVETCLRNIYLGKAYDVEVVNSVFSMLELRKSISNAPSLPFNSDCYFNSPLKKSASIPEERLSHLSLHSSVSNPTPPLASKSIV